MDSESTIGFSFIKNDRTENITLEAGANTDFPEEVWEQIKTYKVVKNLVAYGALRVISEEEHETILEDESDEADKTQSLESVSIPNAMTMIEASHEPDQLQQWLARESRIKLRNAINKRLQAIEQGNA